jgi:hypothetical protein
MPRPSTRNHWLLTGVRGSPGGRGFEGSSWTCRFWRGVHRKFRTALIDVCQGRVCVVGAQNPDVMK